MIGENSLQIYKIFKLPVIPLKESERIKKASFWRKTVSNASPPRRRARQLPYRKLRFNKSKCLRIAFDRESTRSRHLKYLSSSCALCR